MNRTILNNIKVFLFDLDGCIYYGDHLAEGAKEMLHKLRTARKKIGFITNNSFHTATQLAEKMQQFGLQVEEYEIFTVTDCTGLYIQQRFGLCKIKVAGSSGLLNSLERLGHQILPIESDEKADVIVIGKDTEFSYAKLYALAQDALQGTPIIGTNQDRYHPGGKGIRIPEAGALIAAIEVVIGRKVLEYVGKPSSFLFQKSMKFYDSMPNECVMVGDNLETDIAGGTQAGMVTVWINEEESGIRPLETTVVKKVEPNFIISNLKEFQQMLEELKVV